MTGAQPELFLDRVRSATRFGIVLAGGQSRRMGRDKASLVHQGKTLLEHACELLEAACGPGAVVLISGSAPAGMPGKLSRRQGCFVRDEIPELGPLGGIRSVLHELARARPNLPLIGCEFLVHPVDMPRIPVESLSRVLRALPQQEGAASFAGYFLPLAFRLGRRGLEFLEKVAPDSAPQARSIQSFASFMGSKALSVEADPADFGNLNTPEDWRSYVNR